MLAAVSCVCDVEEIGHIWRFRQFEAGRGAGGGIGEPFRGLEGIVSFAGISFSDVWHSTMNGVQCEGAMLRGRACCSR